MWRRKEQQKQEDVFCVKKAKQNYSCLIFFGWPCFKALALFFPQVNKASRYREIPHDKEWPREVLTYSHKSFWWKHSLS